MLNYYYLAALFSSLLLLTTAVLLLVLTSAGQAIMGRPRRIAVRYDIVAGPLTKAYIDDAGVDLHSAVDVELLPGVPVAVATGVYLDVPRGWEVQVRSRSGTALRGVIVANSPGTIDAGYEGEVKAILINLTHQPVTIPALTRVAQLVPTRLSNARIDHISATRSRGRKGLGSSGDGIKHSSGVFH